MRIQAIEIKSFRSLRDCRIRCGDITVLIGRNNHGKSNVLAALDFFCGSANKCSKDDFWRTKTEQATTLWVEVTFSNLSEQETKTFEKYVAADGAVRIRKTASLTQDGKVEIKYQGWLATPKLSWLREDYLGTKKADLEKSLEPYLPPDVRFGKEAIKAAQSAYISKNIESVEFEYVLESGNFLGRASVASGVLPEAFLVPAIKDLNEETKTKNTTLFGKLLNRALSEMAVNDPDFQRVKEDLSQIVKRLNRLDGENDNRPSQLKSLENDLESELAGWDVTLNIQISAPEVEKVFELGTSLQVDDGVITSAEEKGNGLQRAIIFALTRAWARALTNFDFKTEVTPRGASESIYLLIEEPELYLYPHAQRTLASNLREISKAPHHQVFIASHSPQFIDITKYREIAIVEKLDKSGASTVRQSEADLFEGENNVDRKKRFNLSHWLNPDRAELFFARKIIFVEGPTEKVSLPYLAERLNVFDEAVSVIDCGSKFNLPVYMELAGSFRIPHEVVHDEDPIPPNLTPEKLQSAKKTYELNQEISDLSAKTNSVVRMIHPDFEEKFGIPKNQAKIKGKPLAAIDHFESLNNNQISDELKKLVQELYQK